MQATAQTASCLAGARWGTGRQGSHPCMGCHSPCRLPSGLLVAHSDPGARSRRRAIGADRTAAPALAAGKAAPVQGRRHATANPLRAQRVARRAAAPAGRSATVTKAIKVGKADAPAQARRAGQGRPSLDSRAGPTAACQPWPHPSSPSRHSAVLPLALPRWPTTPMRGSTLTRGTMPTSTTTASTRRCTSAGAQGESFSQRGPKLWLAGWLAGVWAACAPPQASPRQPGSPQGLRPRLLYG